MATPEMTAEDFALRIKKSISTVRRIIARGEIDLINVGSLERPSLRITEAAYQKWLKSREIKGRAA